MNIKLNESVVILYIFMSLIFFTACQKKDIISTVTTNDGVQARLAYTDKGYTEVEINPIIKKNCYFPNWDKNIITPVSGLFEYYDADSNWVASIDFGDGTCDEWVTKTWDISIFPDSPNGTNIFSVFDYKDK